MDDHDCDNNSNHHFFCFHHIDFVSWCLNRPWLLLLHQTWFHGWCTTGLSLCIRMEIMLVTPWKDTSTAPYLYSASPISPTVADPWASLTTSPPAGKKNRTSVYIVLHFLLLDCKEENPVAESWPWLSSILRVERVVKKSFLDNLE